MSVKKQKQHLIKYNDERWAGKLKLKSPEPWNVEKKRKSSPG